MSDASRFRNAATEIADGIVAAAKSDDDSVHWMTATLDSAKRVVWHASAGLYSGTSGIALFLLDASEALKRPDYREPATAALSWCLRAAEGSSDYSFYLGRLGIAFTMMRAAAITGDTRHLASALRLGEGYESYAASASVNDLLGGVGGAIIGFLHLHQQTQERWIVDAVHALVRRLVSSARWTPVGLCWDVRREFIKGLCGFSHGAAGVAFALLEAAEYLDEPAYRKLALEALRYEAACYDSSQGAWPDFRKLDVDRGQGYFEQMAMSSESLTLPGVMDAWCHGAPGIALSRLRVLELLGPQWREESMRALARTRSAADRFAQSHLFTLCHGACGNASVFLEAARVFGNPEYRLWAEEIGDWAIASRERNGLFFSGYSIPDPPEELSLMMGNAGIGLFFLKLASGVAIDILSPRLSMKIGTENDPVTIGSVVHTLAERLMPRSMAAIEASRPEECASFFTEWRERADVLAFVTSEGSKAGEEADVALESEKLRMRDQCPSFALVAITRAWEQRRASAFPEDELGSRWLQLAQFSLLWRSGSDMRPSRFLRIVGAHVEETPLTEFSAATLETFTKPAMIAAAISSLEEALETKTAATIDALRAAVHGQVLSALRAGILVVAGSREPTTTSGAG